MRKTGGVGVIMKDKEVKMEETEVFHTPWARWNRGRSCPEEREVKRV